MASGVAGLAGLEGRVVGVSGLKDVGKTRLVEGLVASLRRKGFTVGTAKHAESGVALETSAKDSERHLAAGADCAVAIGASLVQVMVRPEAGHPSEPGDASEAGGSQGGGEAARQAAGLGVALARYLALCDYVIVEGFKGLDLAKVVVLGAGGEMPPALKNVVALVWPGAACDSRPKDVPAESKGLPLFAIDEADKLCEMLLTRGILKPPGARTQLAVNGRPVAMNEFVGSALAGVLQGFVGTLRDVGGPTTIEVTITRPRS
jgi:molybdopterin-guanine dinucleotide biosynthesis protein